MIGNALRIDIEVYAGNFERNVVFAMTMAGRLTKPMVARYVASLHFMLSMTPIHMKEAAARARALGDEALAAHFEHKLEEEAGHEVWAEEDLRALAEERARRPDVVPAARRLAKYIESAIETHPAYYLAYIAFAEYITVMKGPSWLKLLEERCGIPQSSMTAVGNHVELDREHAEEGFTVMDDLVGDPKMLAGMREALAQSMAHFDAYCDEAVNAPFEESGTQLIAAEDDSNVAEHVSAA